MSLVQPNQAESLAIDSLYSGRPIEQISSNDGETLTAYLRIAMEATLMQRSYAFRADELESFKKQDTSDVTEADRDIEQYVRDSLLTAFPAEGFNGEETETVAGSSGRTFVLDPVDGTTSFLYFEQRSGLSLAQIEGKNVPFGLVSHAVVGEIAYAIDNQRTRVIQLGMRKKDTQIRELPVQHNPNHKMTVITQVGKSSQNLRNTLVERWHQKEIGRPQQSFGSPAVAILDSVRGKTVAVLQWLGGGKDTDDFDFAAAFKLVKNAGGKVIITRSNKHGLRAEHTKELTNDALTTTIPNNGIILTGANNDYVDDMYRSLLPKHNN